MGKLLVIQTAFIGDVILVTPLLRAIRQELPGTQVTLMVIPETKNIVETNPFVKNLWVFDKHKRERGLKGFRTWVKRIRQEKFEIAFLPHRSSRSALLARLAKIPIRIGFNRSGAHWLYSHKIAYNYSMHEVVRNLSLLQPLGVRKPGIMRPELYPDERDREVVTRLLDSCGISKRSALIALAPGSIWFTKRWPERYFRDLAMIMQGSGYKVCLIGGTRDRIVGEMIDRNSPEKILNFIGRLSIRQTAELLRHCRLLVSNDSAPTHLGSAMNIPTITIYGSTIPGFGFGPLASRNRILEKNLACRPCSDHGRRKCPLKTLACLREITPREVWQTSRELMEGS